MDSIARRIVFAASVSTSMRMLSVRGLKRDFLREIAQVNDDVENFEQN